MKLSYSSDNNDLHDHKIYPNEILELLKTLNDPELLKFFQQMDFTPQEKSGINLLAELKQNIDLSPKDVQKYIDEGANLEISDDNEMTPLAMAVIRGNIRIVEILLKAGANAKHNIAEDKNMLMLSNDQDISELLIKYGADIHHISAAGYTVLTYLSDKHFIDKDNIKFLLDQGLDIDAMDKNDYNPVFYAVKYNNESFLEFLLNEGANPNVMRYVVYYEYITPLAQAVLNKNTKIIKLLLNFKANPNLYDKKENSPLYIAEELWKKYKYEIMEEIIKILVDAGAKYEN